MLNLNRIFALLMSLSFISAFVAPPRLMEGARAELEGLFIPVSRPTYSIANWLRRKISPDQVQDIRPDADIRRENVELQQQVAFLEARVQRLQSAVGEREKLGDLQKYCERFSVAGADSGNREGLIIAGALLTSVQQGQTVLWDGALVGRIDRSSLNAAHVRLITDPGFVTTGRWFRGKADPRGPADSDPIIVEGAGAGKMIVNKLNLDKVTSMGIAKGDWIVLDDTVNWPDPAQGLRIAQVESIQSSIHSPLHAQITLHSGVDLMQLPNVWVMTHAN